MARPWLNFMRSSTFRLSLFYALLFGSSVVLLLVIIYFQTMATIDQQAELATKADAASLVQQYTAQGLAGLIDAVEDRVEPDRAGDGLYLLVDEDGAPLAGNIRAWPAEEPNSSGWVDFAVERGWKQDTLPHKARGLKYALSDGSKLLVARDLRAQEEFRRVIMDAFFYAFAITLLLGVGGGLLISRRMLDRLGAINRSAERIMTGDLGHRIATTGSNDEFDRLSETLNAMLEEIRRLMKATRRVVDNIAHDLRSPLTRMRTRLEAALGGGVDDEGRRQAIERTLADADQLLATFNALLSIADAETGTARTSLVPLDLGELVVDVAELYEPAAEERGIAMCCNAGGPAGIQGSRQLLFQALSNLIDNAVKFTPAGGTIAILVGQSDAGVVLSVSDTGPGIPAADRENVLQPFVRLDKSRTTPGNGLGLALVAAIAKLHGARLTLDDNAPGLRVSLIFPPLALAA